MPNKDIVRLRHMIDSAVSVRSPLPTDAAGPYVMWRVLTANRFVGTGEGLDAFERRARDELRTAGVDPDVPNRNLTEAQQ